MVQLLLNDSLENNPKKLYIYIIKNALPILNYKTLVNCLMNNVNKILLKSIVKSVIPKENPYWILLSNGTFIVLEVSLAAKQSDLKLFAETLLDEIESQRLTVYAYVEDIISVADFGGWVVVSPFGAYTYVHPSELSDPEPSDLAISVKASLKFMDDCQEKDIVYINTPSPAVSK